MNIKKFISNNKTLIIATFVLLTPATLILCSFWYNENFIQNLYPNIFTLCLEGLLFVVFLEYYKQLEKESYNRRIITIFASYFFHLLLILRMRVNFTENKKSLFGYEAGALKTCSENIDKLPFDDIRRECKHIYSNKDILIAIISQFDKDLIAEAHIAFKSLETIAKADEKRDIHNDTQLLLIFLHKIFSRV